jgi:formate dehydrogenase maturation protein FdhE
MYYTDARDLHYRAGVPRDQKAFFAKLGGQTCPKCGAEAAFSTLNEYADWEATGHCNPMRCAVCQHEWFDE